jgi:hypothetical protein
LQMAPMAANGRQGRRGFRAPVTAVGRQGYPARHMDPRNLLVRSCFGGRGLSSVPAELMWSRWVGGRVSHRPPACWLHIHKDVKTNKAATNVEQPAELWMDTRFCATAGAAAVGFRSCYRLSCADGYVNRDADAGRPGVDKCQWPPSIAEGGPALKFLEPLILCKFLELASAYGEANNAQACYPSTMLAREL